MINKLREYLAGSPTSYHVVESAQQELLKNGFKRLEPSDKWKLKAGDKAFVIIDGSALIAFRIGEGEYYSYNIVASHTDSPCFKLKHNATATDGKYKRLAVEEYGKSLQYTWFDRPLFVAGRVIVRDKKSGALRSVLVRDEKRFVIPSLAIHLNREANSQLKLNTRKDMAPLLGIHDGKDYVGGLIDNPSYEVCDYDLFLCSGEDSFICGANDEFFCAPRLDNQTSAFASLDALIASDPKAIAVSFLADNEEVGSRTKQGAGATVLKDIIWRINRALGHDEEELRMAMADSFIVSCDNSHAVHPNYGELADEHNRNYINNGVVIKHHASQSYTTDGVSSSVIKTIFDQAGVKYQDFYNRADLPSGGTLGAISSSQLSIRSVDIGLPQLGMHSSVETMGTKDYPDLVKGLTCFFGATLITNKESIIINH